jgi:drug/metabolite transporter (DMT)-like permease
VSLTEVLFAVIWAWLLLGELPGPVQLLGGVLIVGGVVLVRVDELRGAGIPAVPVRAPLDHANDVEPVP